jgi:hypothetical protein
MVYFVGILLVLFVGLLAAFCAGLSSGPTDYPYSHGRNGTVDPGFDVNTDPGDENPR